MSRKIISCEDCGAEFTNTQYVRTTLSNYTVYFVVQKSQKIMRMTYTMMKKILNKIPQGLQIVGLGILAILFNWKKIAFYIFVTACFFLMLQNKVSLLHLQLFLSHGYLTS